MAKQRRRFRRTTLISAGLGSFLAGLGVARTKIAVGDLWLLLSALLLLVGLKHLRWLAVSGAIGLGLLLGLVRGQNYLQQVRVYDRLYKRAVILEVRAETDGIYAQNSQLSFDVSQVRLVDPYQINLVGKLAIKGFGTNAVYKGDRLQIEGKLRPTLGAKRGTMSFAQIKVLKRPKILINNIRRRFDAGMLSALPEPVASFALGLLVGQRSTLPQSVTDQLSAVGLTHIVAVSGYNLTIIIQAARGMLKKTSKYQSTILSLVLIGLFLLFAGASPSINRAALVSVLSLIAWYYGRTIKPLLLLLVAAAITAGIYPIYLWSDIGWYLSFLAFFGILMVGPQLHQRIYQQKQPGLIAKLVIECLAAQLLTIPLVMYIFGQVSLISLVANILLVPLVPLAMALVLAAGLGGMLLPLLAGWLAWPGRLLLTYMLDMVGLMSKVPHALAKVGLTLEQMIVCYALMALLTLVLWHGNQKRNRGKSGIIS